VLVRLVRLVVNGVHVARLEEEVVGLVDVRLVRRHVGHLAESHQPNSWAGVIVLADVAAGLEGACHLGLGRFLQRIGEKGLGDERLATAARLFDEMGWALRPDRCSA
jgi:hypothetical protein